MALNIVQINEEIFENEDDVAIRVKNLKVWTPEEKSWWSCNKITKPKTLILNDVTGCIKEGEFAAVIGPSGAGKTTFLVSLAGKCTLPSEGEVTLNGVNVGNLRNCVEIVPQNDMFMDSLSVLEHLTFMTEMKIGSSKKRLNQIILNTVLRELTLKAHENTPISALSGGERRLLSLATSLLSNPSVLIYDEPTTGLDVYNASLVIGALKRLSMAGKIVICSVHQPSYDLFKEFNSVLLMAEGRLLFHGTRDECKNLFESINLHCPMNYNPAEFYIRVVSNQNHQNIEKIAEKYHEKYVRCNWRCHDISYTREHSITLQRNWFKQVHLLLWRMSLTLKRDVRNHLVQLFVTVAVSSLVLVTCYVGVSGTNQRGIQDIRGFIWLITSEVSFSMSYNALYMFESEIVLFRREIGIYRCSAYLVSKFLSFIPRCIIWPITLVFIATFAVELPNHIITAIEFVAVMIISAVASVAYGLGMSTLFTSTGIINDVMPCTDLPLFLMSGAFLRISSMPFWLYPVKYISHFYYAMDAISNVYWRQIDHIECEVNSTTSACLKDGISVLSENGYSNNFIFQDCLGLLFVTLLWSLLSYYGLRREEKKGYVY